MTPAIALALLIAWSGTPRPAVPPGPGLAPPTSEEPAARERPAPTRVSSAPEASAANPLLGEDKLRHLGMAFAVTQVAFGVTRLGLSADHARPTAIGLAAVASIGKELYDVRRGRRFDALDLAWDIVGIALGAVLIHQID